MKYVSVETCGGLLYVREFSFKLNLTKVRSIERIAITKIPDRLRCKSSGNREKETTVMSVCFHFRKPPPLFHATVNLWMLGMLF